MTISNFTVSSSAIDRLDAFGVSALSDTELLSLFLTAKAGVCAEERARKLINTHGGLIRLLALNNTNAIGMSGFTKRQLAQIIASRELASRALAANLINEDALTSPENVRAYLASKLQGQDDEIFAVLYLDNRHRVQNYRELFRGTLDSCAVYPRVIVRSCLELNSAAIILSHQHPSGVAEPSDTDVRLTRKVSEACAIHDIRVLDHIVCGQGVQTSLAERGLI